MSVTVRDATTADADAIGRIHVQSWREAYSGIFPADFLSSLDVQQRMDRWAEIIAGDDVRVLIASVGGTEAAWATTGQRPLATAPRTLELEGLYVLRQFYGSGVAQALIDAALGTAPAYLWMADPNPRAESFYLRNGFSRDGQTSQREFGSAQVTTVCMVR